MAGSGAAANQGESNIPVHTQSIQDANERIGTLHGGALALRPIFMERIMCQVQPESLHHVKLRSIRHHTAELFLTGALTYIGTFLLASSTIAMGSETAGGRDMWSHAPSAIALGGMHFTARHQAAVSKYYRNEFDTGTCPPGLVHVAEGCMSPIRTRTWQIGKSLPRNLIAYELPPELAAQLPSPRGGGRYVRVATDILLIAPDNAIIVDAVRASAIVGI